MSISNCKLQDESTHVSKCLSLALATVIPVAAHVMALRIVLVPGAQISLSLGTTEEEEKQQPGVHTEVQRQIPSSQRHPAPHLSRASSSAAAAATSPAGLGAAMARLAKRAKATVVSLMVAVLLVFKGC